MEPGTRFGRYRLVRQLGTGGMGTVWDAVLEGPRGFRKPVALKVMHRLDLNEEIIEEAKLGGLLQHPNVVATLELGCTEGRWFMSMERVDGGTLHEQLAKGVLPLDAVLDVGIQTAAGLAHLHELVVDGASRPLIHRDIKPANLMLDATGLVKLCDLGIARVATRPGSPCGTPGFMPPEQYEGRETPLSDQFALGMTLFLLATRRRLFGTGAEVRAQTFDVDAVVQRASFLEALGDAATLAPILRRCLAFDPAERFASAEELGRALRLLRADTPGPGLASTVTGHTGPIAAGTTLGTDHGERPRAPAHAFGRRRQARTLVGALNDGRSLALFGPPGVGKSHLAQVVLAAAPDRRAVWVDANELPDLAALILGCARALGLQAPALPDATWLARSCHARGVDLLVLDGVEAGEAVDVLLAELASTVQVVVTSRLRRQLPSWHAERVQPLDPDDAAALYRTLAHDEPTDAVVEQLVETLDGLPLALVLAASRTSRVRSEDVLDGLKDRFRMLRDRHQDARHRALDFALEESWERLGSRAVQVLEQICVFQGPFELDAVEAVCHGSAGVLDALDELVDASLLESVEDRFVLLRSIRDFARHQARDLPTTRARHATWYAQLGAPAALAALDRRGGSERFERLVQANPEVQAAFTWACEVGSEDAGPLALALLAVIRRRGPLGDALAIVDAALTAPQSLETLAPLLERAAECATGLGEVERAIGFLDTGIVAARHLEPEVLASLLLRRALVDLHAPEARSAFEEAAQIAADAPDLALRARVANTRWMLDDDEPALLDAFRYAEAGGSDVMVSRLLNNLGFHHQRLGDYERALPLLRQSAHKARDHQDHTGRVRVLLNLGALYLELDAVDDAEAMYVQAERVIRRAGMLVLLPMAVLGRADVAARHRRWSEALRLNRKAIPLCVDDASLRRAVANEVGVLLELGRTQDALQALQVVPTHDDLGGFTLDLAWARTAALLGDADVALAARDRALVYAERSGDPTYQLETLAICIHVAAALHLDAAPHQRAAEALVERHGWADQPAKVRPLQAALAAIRA